MEKHELVLIMEEIKVVLLITKRKIKGRVDTEIMGTQTFGTRVACYKTQKEMKANSPTEH